MNRRNVLTGLGGLAISGGALFGTGAFTSVEAQRTVDVNVVVADDLDGIDSGDDAAAIAEKYVDVRVDVGSHDSVYVNDASDSTSSGNKNGSGYQPKSGSAVGDQEQVSLIANDDPTIIFGSTATDGGLPQNSTVNYSNLFILDNADIGNTTQEAFDVTLSVDNNNNSKDEFLDIDGDGSVADVFEDNFDSGTGSGGPKKYSSDVNTATSDESLTLTIKIQPEGANSP